MHRIALILAIAACSDATASKPDAPAAPTNLVCERAKELPQKPECKPELSGEGELLTHRARLTFAEKDAAGKESKQTVSCVLVDRALSVECGGLFVTAKQEQAQTFETTEGRPAPVKPAPQKPAAQPATKQGAKK